MLEREEYDGKICHSRMWYKLGHEPILMAMAPPSARQKFAARAFMENLC